MRVYPELTVDAEFQSLGDLGYTGALNDRQYSFLSAQGLLGGLADMMYSWRNNPFVGFAVNSLVPTLVADMTNDRYTSDGLTASTFDDLFTHSRLGNATMVDSDGLLKWAPHNLALNSAAPATQSIAVVSGADYTVECTGSGSITLSGAGTGTVTEGNPVEVTASTTSLTLTVAGDVDLMWCYRSDLGGMAPVPVDARVAGSTTYVPTTSTAKYLPRRHNHVYENGAWVDAGTLIETEARTNLATYSIPVNAQWTTGQVTITENATTAPDGTATASEITEDSTANFHFARPAFITMGAVPHTVSCYLKAGTTTTASLFLAQSGNAGAVFDLSAGTISSVSGTGNTAAIEDAGNGWYRCIVTNDGGADLVNQVRVGVGDGALAASNGDGVSSVYAWGLQVEAASTPSSYIPTSGSAATRAADTSGLTIDSSVIGAALGGSMPAAVCIQVKGRATGNSYTTLRWYADASNYVTQEIGTTDFTFEQAASGTVDSVTGGSITSGVNVPFNIASRHGSTFINGAVGGTALTADTTPVALPDLSGTGLSVGHDFMGCIEEVRIWAVDIGDTGIAEATT